VAVEAELRPKYAALAAEAGRDLESATPQEVLIWAAETFQDKLCLTSSMADALMIDLASRVRPGIDVVFLDTGYHFAETLQTRDEVTKRYPIELTVVHPKQSVAQQDAMFGARLHDRDPDACCTLRKVEPLRRSLEPYYAWASGIRRDESSTRRRIGVVEWDDNRSMVKVNPLANWTQAQVDEYIAEHDVVLNPLLSQGYPSIGCAPCTRKVKPGESARAGRWAGSGKSECGLHVDSAGPGLDLTGGSFISLGNNGNED
jgi:phosphoadenosine phosphosulfate reductase